RACRLTPAPHGRDILHTQLHVCITALRSPRARTRKARSERRSRTCARACLAVTNGTVPPTARGSAHCSCRRPIGATRSDRQRSSPTRKRRGNGASTSAASSTSIPGPTRGVVARMVLRADALTAGVKLTNILFLLRFFATRGLKVYPRKSNFVFGYF